jgi:hypothetical protein
VKNYIFSDESQTLGFFKPARAKAAAAGGQLPKTATFGKFTSQLESRMNQEKRN